MDTLYTRHNNKSLLLIILGNNLKYSIMIGKRGKNWQSQDFGQNLFFSFLMLTMFQLTFLIVN